MIYKFVADKLREDHGIECELISPVNQELSHWFWTYTEEGKMPPEEACQKIYDEMLSLKDYKASKFCYADTDHRNTMYGWVMNRDGVIHHLRTDMTHGLVISALEPVTIALAEGYIAPPMDSKYACISLGLYTDMAYSGTYNHGYIRYDQRWGGRIDFHHENVTLAQVNALKDWFTYHDMLDDSVELSYNSVRIRNLLADMNRIIAERKLDKGVEDFTLIEPNEDELGI